MLLNTGADHSIVFCFIFQPKGKVCRKRALDCGAGIGRITKRLLLPHFDIVNLVDVNQEFLDEARHSYLEKEASRVEQFFCCGLQNFTPEAGHYDVIWCQWVLGHLSDNDFIDFFQRCQDGLAENGMIFIKENVNPDSDTDFDENDSSVCRPKQSLVAMGRRHLRKPRSLRICDACVSTRIRFAIKERPR